MLRRARIARQPIHPIVVGLPIALFTTTLVMLVAFVGTHDTVFYRAAMVASLTGVTMAALAAIPGTLDLLALPKDSQLRRTGIKHGSLALATVGIFAIAAAVLYRNWALGTMRGGEWQLDAEVPLAITTLGMVTLVIAGALGWMLVRTGTAPARAGRRPQLSGASPQPS